MPDEIQVQESTDSTAETTAAESQTAEQTTSTGEAETKVEETSTASSGEKTEQAQGTQAKQEFKPVSRRSSAYRIQQLLKENSELKQGKPSEGEGDRSDEQPDIDQRVQQAVERALKPVISESTKAADDSELAEFFSGDKAAERQQYEPGIRELWKHPQYEKLSASDAYKLLTFDGAVAAAATKAVEEYKAAQVKAKGQSSGGSSTRTGEGKEKDAWALSEKEFQDELLKVKTSR